MFFNILDVASLAAYLIYYENNKMLPKKTNQRRLFLRQLSEELATPMIEDRYHNVQIMRNYSTKITIESVIGWPVNPVEADPGPSVSTRCIRKEESYRFLPYLLQTIKKRRKTRKACSECDRPICDEHAITFAKCIECNK